MDGLGDAEAFQRLGVGVERVGGQVEADRFGLERQALQRRPVGHVGQAQRFGLAGDAAEQADLAAFLFLLVGLGAAQDRFGTGEQAGAVGVEPVEGAGADEVLDLHAVDLARIDAGGEIGDVGERRVAAGGDDGFHRGEADLLDRGEGVADGQAAVLQALDREIGAGAVDVRRQDRDAGCVPLPASGPPAGRCC